MERTENNTRPHLRAIIVVALMAPIIYLIIRDQSIHGYVVCPCLFLSFEMARVHTHVDVVRTVGGRVLYRYVTFG